MLRRPVRLFHTLRHLRPEQIVGRIAASFRRFLGLVPVPTPPEHLTASLDPKFSFLHHDPWNRAESLRRGRVTFLNETRNLGRPWDWHPEGAELSWLFHLHYFNYLYLLEGVERRELALAWMERNPVGKRVAWHPYPTSLRIVNWCRLFSMSAPTEIRESLYRQAGYLARNVETHLSGNHVLENARALVVAGCYFDSTGEAPEWLDAGLRLYRHELPEQVLPDGGHYERSPMYHILVLEGILDVLNVLPDGHGARRLFRETAERMLRFLRGTLHPDGKISLLNDATFDGAPPPARILAYASGVMGDAQDMDTATRSLDSFPDTGIHRYRVGRFTIVLDVGPLGPDHQPAHGHADAFTYELSVGEDRIVTDSGVFGYRNDEMRDYCRGTRAHNTVEVDGTDQAELWGAFRVGRRYVAEAPRVRLDGTTLLADARFDGYAELVGDGIGHRRRLRCEGRAGILCVEDRVEGRGKHSVVSRIHLHPDVEVRPTAEGFRLEATDTALLLKHTGAARVARGWYCPQFGIRRRRSVICLGGSVRLPAALSYQLTVLGEPRPYGSRSRSGHVMRD